MKKILGLIAGFVLAASTAMAGSAYLGVGGGVDVPLSPAGGQLGFGGRVLGGYSLNEHFSLQVDADIMFASYTGFSILDIRPLAEVKYSFGDNKIKPYIIGGLGLDLATISTGGSSSNLDGAAGAGLDIDLEGKATLFVEAKYNMVFATGTTGSDLPIVVGVTFPLGPAAP
jgi:hypothetical protein